MCQKKKKKRNLTIHVVNLHCPSLSAFKKKHHRSHSTKNITFQSVVYHRIINSIPNGFSPFELSPRAAHSSTMFLFSEQSIARVRTIGVSSRWWEYSSRLLHSKNSFNQMLSFPPFHFALFHSMRCQLNVDFFDVDSLQIKNDFTQNYYIYVLSKKCEYI